MRRLFWPMLAAAIFAGGSAAAEPSGALQLAGRALAGAAQGNAPPMGLPLQLLVLMGLLAVLPGMLLLMTAFTRIVIVLALLRQALGLGQTPPNQVIVGLALFLTLFVMAPQAERIDEGALKPYAAGQIPLETALDRGSAELRGFMVRQTRARDLRLFLDLARRPPLARGEEVPFAILAPAFVTSELKTAFEIGYLIFLPFLVIDLVVASVLMALGMMMLSPTTISLPIKLALFVMVDGWVLACGSLVSCFGGGS
ncbi:MAG: flagellar type III secretion system pore protein FliP [Sphingomonadaceae bacterium]|nr:flagellar type III secretion system pore protein FliP [Sphingomonadaceae bacterium]